MKENSRRGKKGGKGDRGARVGKTDRRNCDVGWRAHTATSMSALPLTYIVRSANKDVALPQLKEAQRMLNRQGKRVGKVIADRQHCSEDIFKAVGRLRAEPVIPHPSNVKEPLIDLWLNKRFKVKGDSRLVERTSSGWLLREDLELESLS
jgi:hypothetical protein